MGSTLEMILVIVGFSFWFLFPIGIFLSVSKLDKNTDQVVRLENLRGQVTRQDRHREVYHAEQFDWHHPIVYFRRWLQHE